MIRIGDRVKVILANESIKTTRGKILNGATGTVKDLIKTCAGVEFDEDIGGHCGDWNGKDRCCWYIIYEHLEKIGDTEEETAVDTEKETKEEAKEEVKEETKVDTLEQKILEALREEIGVEIGEEFDVYENGEKQWTCKFEENGFFDETNGKFRKTGLWKNIICKFHRYQFKRKPFVPEYGKDFFLLVEERDENNNIIFVEKRSVWVDSTVDCGMLALGNVFRSKEEALENKDKVLEKLEKLRRGEV